MVVGEERVTGGSGCGAGEGEGEEEEGGGCVADGERWGRLGGAEVVDGERIVWVTSLDVGWRGDLGSACTRTLSD